MRILNGIFSEILRILRKIPKGTILDLGCMDDYLLKKLPNKFNYLGYDLSPLCRHTKIIRDKVENIPKNKKFDLVMATEVLEHVDDPVLTIKKMKSLSNKFILI